MKNEEKLKLEKILAIYKSYLVTAPGKRAPTATLKAIGAALGLVVTA